MNHCIHCGRRISRGRSHRTDLRMVRCQVCITAESMRTFRYVSPASKRWRKKNDMIAKINLTLEQDEQRGTNEAMQETIALLAQLETMPAMKLVLTLECEEIIAEQYRQRLRLGLKRRPIGIIAKVKTTSEEQIIVIPPTTPMDAVLDSVTLSSGSQTVTLTAETARNASAMLRNSGELFED